MKHLWPLGPAAPPEDRFEAALTAYEESTGRSIGRPPHAEDAAAVRRWLVDVEMHDALDENGQGVALLSTSQGPLIHPDAASKAGYFQQASCRTCLPDLNRTPFSVSFAVRTRPFSAQSLDSADLALLKHRIAENLLGRFKTIDAWLGSELCAAVVAVLGASDRLKDGDNMVKGLLDALQGSVYLNDSSISHLNVHRLRHSARDGFYLVNVRPTLDPLSDVVDTAARIAWPGRVEITLDP